MDLCLYANNASGITIIKNVDDVYPLVVTHSERFYDRVKSSILEHGMDNPIVVLPISVSEWKKMREIDNSLLPPPNLPDDTVIHQIRCGHNRWRAAKELRYKYIHAYIARSLDEGSVSCQEQRKDF